MSETKIPTSRIDTSIEFDFSEVATNDGTAALPAYSFTSDQDTGIYHPGVNQLAISTNGVMRASISTASMYLGVPFQIDEASVSLPAYSFNSDVDTGIYHGATANEFNFATGGVERMRLKNAALEMRSGVIENTNGSISLPSYAFASDTDTGLYSVSGNTIGISTGAISIATLNSTGALLQNNNTDNNQKVYRIGSTAYSNSATYFPITYGTASGAPGTNDSAITIGGGTGAGYASNFIYFNTAANDTTVNGTTRMTIDPSGFVGIGTALPSLYNSNLRQLVVANSAGNVGMTFRCSTNSQINIGFQDAENTTATGRIAYTHTAADATDNMIFRVGTVDVLTLLGSGQLQYVDGSAATPAVSFASDTDTGIYRPTTNAIALTANGSNMIRCDYATNITFSVNGASKVEVGTNYLSPQTDNAIRLGDPTLRWSVINMADGSVGSPSYTFGGDPDTGIYHSTANQIDFAVGGLAGLSINSNQQTLHRTGTISLPSISFAGDPDTGLYSAGSGVIDVTGNGASMFDFNPTVNRSKVLLQILATGIQNVDGTAAAPSYTFGSDSSTGFSRNGFIVASVAGTERMRIATNQVAFLNVTSVNPSADNVVSCGASGQRWTQVWAASGTINTSHSSTKSNIVEIDPTQIEIPQGVFYDRDGRRHVGYLNDNLPIEARPIDDGKIVETMNYEHSVIGVLCAHVKKLENDNAELKTLVKDLINKLEA